MSTPARITSTDELEAFRGALLEFISKARKALDDATSETRRTREWLAHDRVRHWQHRMKVLEKQVEQAEQELYSVRLTAPHDNHATHRMTLIKARRAHAEATEKARKSRFWRQQFDHKAEAIMAQLAPLQHQVDQALPKAVHCLGESIKAIQAYTGQDLPSRPPKSEP